MNHPTSIRCITRGLSIAMFLMWSHDALGQLVTFDSQARMVRATANTTASGGSPDADSETVTAPDFGAYSDDALAGAVSTNLLPDPDTNFATVNSTAPQASRILRKSVEAFGETNIGVDVTGSASGAGTAVSTFQYQFTIDNATNYSVLGQISRFGPVSDGSLELLNSLSNQVFAIGEANGYASTTINTSGVLAAGSYTLTGFADTESTFTAGTGGLRTAGAEFEFMLSLDVVAPGEIVNGGFLGITGFSDIFGWSESGLGTTQLAQVGGDSLLLMESGSPAIIQQDGVDTPNVPFLLTFDYEFLDTSGDLDVRLNSQLLATLSAPGTLTGTMETFQLLVDSPALLNQFAVPLQFEFDGPSAGLQLQLDNVFITPVPEPSSLILLGACLLGVGLARSRVFRR